MTALPCDARSNNFIGTTHLVALSFIFYLTTRGDLW